MVGMLDIAPARRVVTVLGQEIEVRGIPLRAACALLTRFPRLWDMIEQRGVSEVSLAALAELVPDAIEPILAAGTGNAGDAQAEARAAELDIQTQADLFAPIMELTMPRGFGPFVETLTRLAGMFSLGTAIQNSPGAAEATSSR
jgi:hypothetical protein